MLRSFSSIKYSNTYSKIYIFHCLVTSLKISVKLSSLWAEVFKVFLVSSLGKNISIHVVLETYKNVQVKLSLAIPGEKNKVV